MKICIPVGGAHGLTSVVSEQFADAPCLLIYDPQDGSLTFVDDWRKTRARGMCEPVRELLSRGVDRVVSRGMGLHGIEMLAAHGIEVLRTDAATAGEALDQVLDLGRADPQGKHTCP